MKSKLITALGMTLLTSITYAAEPAPAPANDGAVWDAITARSKAARTGVYSPEHAALLGRDKFKAYFETFKDWTPPPPLTPPAGKFANLPDKPVKPRFEVTGKVWPANPGEASICLWEDDKTAAYSFSIDDNLATDVPFWIDLSKKYGDLKITWNLITVNIDGTFEKGRVASAGTWAFWQGVVDQGFHVASHSVTHNGNPVRADGWPGPVWEAAESKRVLDANLPSRKTKLFAYPGSAFKEFDVGPKFRPDVVKYYAAQRGTSGNSINVANQIDYFDIRTTSNPAGYLAPADPRFAEFNVTNILNENADGRFKKYYRGWFTTFIHGVGGGKDWGKTPYTKGHADIFDWVTANRNEIWIGYLDDVALYGQERDTATVRTVQSSDQSIEFSLESKMDPATFDYPLTVKVRLPSAWKSGVTAKQGDRTADAKTVSHEGNDYALIKALPNGANVVLTPKS